MPRFERGSREFKSLQGYLMKRLKFYAKHWKLGLHLILRTKHFGVNNQWWVDFQSVFGVATWRIWWDVIRIYPLFRNYRLMKFRAMVLHFMSDEECEIAGYL